LKIKRKGGYDRGRGRPFGGSKAEGNAATNHEIREGKQKMKKTMKIASMVAVLAMVLTGVASHFPRKRSRWGIWPT